MTAKIIDCKEIAEKIYKEVTADIKLLKEKYDIKPGLAVILVGEDPASLSYVRSKKKMCEQLGMYSEEYKFISSTQETDVIKLVEQLNYNPSIHGILVQIPLPKEMDTIEIQKAVSPYKDVDGFNPENMGRLLAGRPRFVSCTPLGIQELLIRSGIEIGGKHVVIVGRSNIVGKPLAVLLMQKHARANATVTVCHSKSNRLKEIIRQGDIVVVAIGSAGFLKADMVKEGAVVIDVGINRVADSNSKTGYRMTGDVDFDSVKEVTSYITPVPRGVGPMTIAMLMYNTVKAAKASVNL